MAVDLSWSGPDGYAIITTSGEIDRASVEILDGALWQSVERLGPAIVDLLNVSFLDLSALHCLARAHAAAQGYGASVHLVRPTVGPVALLLDVSGLCNHLPMPPDVGACLRSLGSGRDQEQSTGR